MSQNEKTTQHETSVEKTALSNYRWHCTCGEKGAVAARQSHVAHREALKHVAQFADETCLASLQRVYRSLEIIVKAEFGDQWETSEHVRSSRMWSDAVEALVASRVTLARSGVKVGAR